MEIKDWRRFWCDQCGVARAVKRWEKDDAIACDRACARGPLKDKND